MVRETEPEDRDRRARLLMWLEESRPTIDAMMVDRAYRKRLMGTIFWVLTSIVGGLVTAATVVTATKDLWWRK